MGIESSYYRTNLNNIPNNPFKTPAENINEATQEIQPVAKSFEAGKEGESDTNRRKREQQAQITLAKLAELNANRYKPTSQNQNTIDSIRKQIQQKEINTPPTENLSQNKPTPDDLKRQLQQGMSRGGLGRSGNFKSYRLDN